MLTKLLMEIDVDTKDFSYQKGSVLQGIIMEQIDSNYAEELHLNSLNPYSQAVYNRGGKLYWEINALDQKAKEQIIDIMERKNEFLIKKREQNICILKKQLYQKTESELARGFYQSEASNIIKMTFFTPTAFKQNGAYTFFPDIRCIYQSLMKKYDAVPELENMYDEEMLRYLVENTKMIEYNLRSVRFGLERTGIPAFLGNITLKIQGAQTLVNFANILFEFASYSGVGIKTSMGMGKVEVEQRGKRKNDRKTD